MGVELRGTPEEIVAFIVEFSRIHEDILNPKKDIKKDLNNMQ